MAFLLGRCSVIIERRHNCNENDANIFTYFSSCVLHQREQTACQTLYANITHVSCSFGFFSGSVETSEGLKAPLCIVLLLYLNVLLVSVDAEPRAELQ